MSEHIPVESALTILQSAFSPLRCVAESWDYGNQARFRVFDADDPLVSMHGLLRGQVTDSRRLEWLINHVRENLTERGYVLDPWQFPGGLVET